MACNFKYAVALCSEDLISRIRKGEDYAYQIVNETDGHPVRFGKQSIRIELRKGDCHQRRKGSYNDCKASPPAERHEFGMEHGDVSPIRGTTWHTYSLYLPKDTPQIHSEWITMGQFHNIDYDKPPINLDLSGKHFYLVTRLLCIHPKKLNKTCYSNEPGNTRKKILDSKKIYGSKNVSDITVEDVLLAAKQFVNF